MQIGKDLTAVLDYIEEKRKTHQVCVLLSGDPCLYSLLPLLNTRFGATTLEVIPGISSLQLALARLGMPMQNVTFSSFHGRNVESLAPLDYTRPVALLTDTAGIRLAAKRLLPSLGDRRVHLCFWLSYANEDIISSSLAEMEDQSLPEGPAVMIIYPAAKPITRFLPDSAFIRGRVPMTKEEVRHLMIALGDPSPTAVVWDIGCGTGSIACEAALLTAGGKVYAVDKNPDAVELTEKNAGRFGLLNVVVKLGEAPAIYDFLPEPDLIFIGGSGPNRDEVIGKALARLGPGGKLVLTAITLETVATAHRVFNQRPDLEWDGRLVSAARLEHLGALTALQAANPVFILRARRIMP